MVAGTRRAVRASRLVTESSSRMMRSPGPTRISALYRRAPRMVRSSKYRTATVLSSTATATVFTSVPNISIHPSQSTCGRLSGPIVPRGKAQRERGSASHFALDRNCAVELLHDALRDGQAEAKPAPFGRDEVIENRREALCRNARAGVGDDDLDLIARARRCDRDAAAGLGCLDRVRDQITVHAAEREAVALDHEGARRVGGVHGDAVPLALAPHRLDHFRHRAVDVHREALDRLRLDDVPQVFHEPLQRLELALDRAAEHLP